jgi:histidyl-tRNA synthetase
MIKAIAGTRDILPDEISKWKLLEESVERVFRNFNYKEIRTPVFEKTELFARGIGEETDIVGKEMYSFTDTAGNSMTLKPEMTAAVVRAYIEHSIGKQQSLSKLFYIAPMFRKETPQAGRQRQFHQFGAEAIGSSSPILDAEMIQMVWEILTGIGLKHLTVKINSLGTPASRENYKNILREFLSGKKDQLSEESRKRYEKNILRLFDSKVESDQAIMKNAPMLLDYIDSESREDFDAVKEILTISDIPFEIEPMLVRGLDYYTRTTFEIISGKVGAQSALCGGGRYDLLIEQLGGTPAPGVGFAAGMERILLACENEKSLNLTEESIDVYIVLVDRSLVLQAVETSLWLRKKNLTVDFDYLNRSVKAQMREANKFKAKYVLFLEGNENKEGKYNIKNMSSGEQSLINKIDLEKLLIKESDDT